MDGRCVREASEFRQRRTVRELVWSVLPAPFQSRSPKMSPSDSLAIPEAATQHGRMSVQSLSKLPEVCEGEADVGTTASPVRQGASDRRAAEGAFNGGKWFASKIAAVAAMLDSPSQGSGVDWKHGSQGLELILNSGREYVSNPSGDCNADFERATYINGVQHVLQGLPRDLEPAEAAMLQRAIPPALAASVSLEDGGQNHARRQENRNWVHVIAFCLLCCLARLAALIGPKVVLLSSVAMRLEKEHKLGERAAVAAVRIFRALPDVFRWAGDSVPGRFVSAALGYTSQGVYAAIQEFAAKSADQG
ncbi:hypothetical protein VTK56DRAFT_3926 [Thermocarpiscus australiensis]